MTIPRKENLAQLYLPMLRPAGFFLPGVTDLSLQTSVLLLLNLQYQSQQVLVWGRVACIIAGTCSHASHRQVSGSGIALNSSDPDEDLEVPDESKIARLGFRGFLAELRSLEHSQSISAVLQ